MALCGFCVVSVISNSLCEAVTVAPVLLHCVCILLTVSSLFRTLPDRRRSKKTS